MKHKRQTTVTNSSVAKAPNKSYDEILAHSERLLTTLPFAQQGVSEQRTKEMLARMLVVGTELSRAIMTQEHLSCDPVIPLLGIRSKETRAAPQRTLEDLLLWA